MAKYTTDANLIKGARTAYKNYDNATGIYSGLDKLTEAGDVAIQERKANQKLAEDELKAEKLKSEEEQKLAKAEKSAQDKAWYNISGSVYENAGSFQKDVEYKDTASSVTALKEEWMAAQKSGDAEEMAAVQIKFNNIKGEVDDHKAFRETITDPKYGLSNAMNNSGVPEGDNGEDKVFMTALVNEEYTISRNKDGEKVYTIGDTSKTMKQIKDTAILKNNIPYAAYSQSLNKYAKAKDFNRENTEYDVRNNIVPQEVNELRAFLSDDGFGNGKNFKALLSDSKNKASIKSEIDSVFNTDNTVGISDAEYNNFVEAIVDPRHKFWENNGGEAAWQESSSRIATEQLTNGIENKWTDNQPTDIINENLNVPKNRTEEFQFLLPNGTYEKTSTSTNQLISLDNQLSDLKNLNKSSFDGESYVDLFGSKVGYFPGKGFAPIKIRDDGQLTIETKSNTKMPKGGYWKSPMDVFKHYSIPTHNQKAQGGDIVEKNGKKYRKVDGGYMEIK